MNSSLDMGQKLALGGETIALGLLVVFVCLALIILLITLLSYILKERKKSETQKAEPSPLPELPVVEVQDDELLAVLSAAIAAAMEREGSSSPFVIRSYRRMGRTSAWNSAGRDSQITNW